MIVRGLTNSDRERIRKKRAEGHCSDKDEAEIKKTPKGRVMLRWRCISSAGDITMSAVLNMRDDTFMCEAIKSDEARPGGIGRIYSPCFCLYSFSITSYLHFFCCSVCVWFLSAQLTLSPQIILLFISQPCRKLIQKKNAENSFLIQPYRTPLSPFFIFFSLRS